MSLFTDCICVYEENLREFPAYPLKVIRAFGKAAEYSTMVINK